MKTPAEELEAIYREVPQVNCKRLCQECCGPIAAFEVEMNRMEEASGAPIPSTRLMPLHVASGQKIGDARVIDCHVCPLLKDGACSIYNVRPLICRLWGAVQAMRCPHGCTPKRWVGDRDAGKLMERVRKLSERVARQQPRI